MNRQAQIIIVVLMAVVVGLAVSVGVMAAGDDDNNGAMSGSMDGNDASMGMMGATVSMDSDAMRAHMREALGEEGYQRMLNHLAGHRNGGPMAGDAGVDQMMHSVMDGMMQHMPADANSVMPPANAEHHKTPSP